MSLWHQKNSSTQGINRESNLESSTDELSLKARKQIFFKNI